MAERKMCPKSGLALYQFDGMPTTETWEARCDECGQVVTIERYSIIPWHYMPEPLADTDDAAEAQRVAEYHDLIDGGLSDAEARGTIWPDTDEGKG